jgi:peptidoglycan-associated lipoprotein
MRAASVVSGVSLSLLLAGVGCATKGFVKEQVGALDRRVDDVQGDLSQKVEQTNREVSSLEGTTSDMRADIDGARALALGATDLDEVERHRVYFEFDSDELGADQKAVLDQVVATLEASPRYVVNVLGFTDPTGTDRYNADLGRRRAEAVVRYLVDNTGDHLRRYQILSFGEGAPRHEETELGEGGKRRQALVVVLEPTAASERTDLSRR